MITKRNLKQQQQNNKIKDIKEEIQDDLNPLLFKNPSTNNIKKSNNFLRNQNYNIYFSEFSQFITNFSKRAPHQQCLTNNDISPLLLKTMQPVQVLKESGINKDIIYKNQEDLVMKILKSQFQKCFFNIGCLKLANISFLFSSPFFLDTLTDELKKPENFYNILVYSLLLLMAFILQAVTNNQYEWQIRKLRSKSNIIITSLIQDRALLHKQNRSSKSENEHQNEEIETELNTILAVDIELITDFYTNFHETWSLALQIIIGFIFLYIYMAQAMLVGLFVTFGLAVINLLLAQKIGREYETLMHFKDERVRITNEVLQGIKQVKMLGWEKKILGFRHREYKSTAHITYLDAFSVFFWSFSSILISAASFLAYYFMNNNNLDSINVFTSIYVFGLIVGPLNSIAWTITGPTASGKSALVNLLLQEEKWTSEKLFYIADKIAYVGQQVWLQNQTIRDNILFGSTYDREKYEKVIQISQLLSDFEHIPSKDFHIVGPGGQNVSGGQKQRIAIARALYHREQSDIFIFDDPFTSLDLSVTSAIYEQALKQYLKNKTVILATSNSKLINKEVDQVILVSENHQVTTRFFRNIQILKIQFQRTSVSKKQRRRSKGRTKYVKLNDTSIIEHKEPEKKEFGELKWKIIRFYWESMGLGWLITISLSLILMQWSNNFYDTWLNAYIQKRKSVHDLRCFSFGLGNLNTSRYVFLKLQDVISYAKLPFYESREIGQILNRISADTHSVDANLGYYTNMLLKSIFTIAGSFFTISIQSPILLVPILFSSFLFYSLQQKFRCVYREIRRLSSINTSNYLNIMNETYGGLQTIRAFKKQEITRKNLMDSMTDLQNSSLLLHVLRSWFSIRLQMLSTLITMSILGVVVTLEYFSISNEKNSNQWYAMTPHTVALCLTYSLTITGILQDFTMNFVTTEKELISLERINQYYSVETEKDQLVAADESNEQKHNFSADPINKLIFENVSLCYSQSNTQAVKNVSFQINKQQKVLVLGINNKIVGQNIQIKNFLQGRTGSGKSSLVNILLRLYENQQGKVLINEKDISSISISQLRSQIGMVPQHGFLFEGTMRQNIDLTNEFSDEQIEKCFQKGWSFNKLKKFLISIFALSNKGGNLSEGEKQIIFLIRLMLNKRVKIIILDEASANLDENYEEFFQNYVKNEKERIVIVISHKYDHINNYDKVMVMKQGEVIAFESPKTILQNNDLLGYLK